MPLKFLLITICYMCTTFGFSVVGYLPEWRYLNWPEHEQWRWKELCKTVTHLILFSIEVKANGDFASIDRFPLAKTLKYATDAASSTGTKLLICFGGNSRTNGFPEMVSSKITRTKFIDKLVNFCLKKRLNGVDYNWEYPYNQSDWDNLFLLIAETKEKFTEHNLIITMAYYPDLAQEKQIKTGNLKEYVDLFLMMSYDQPGKHSTFEFAKNAVQNGISLIPNDKIALGLPFYSRNVRTGDWKTYEDLVKVNYDKIKNNPKLNQISDDYFNGVFLIKKKTKLALSNNLGGVMIWEIGQDHFDNSREKMGELSLLSSIAEVIQDTANVDL